MNNKSNSKKRDNAAGYGSVGNRGKTSNGLSKMEDDHCKSNPKHGRSTIKTKKNIKLEITEDSREKMDYKQEH